ncbi:MAG: single-stranded DNA-binding protein [Spirochaetes bacterium]|nr:single-stranded DNA-binding protein [Spirochaetota bacterium]MCK5268945.1 single-stranded DNA-binding protein [Spirochaetota bacterium]
MKNLNFIILEGNLVKDPEYKETDSGMPMCRFVVANNYSFKKEGEWIKDVNYFNIVT